MKRPFFVPKHALPSEQIGEGPLDLYFWKWRNNQGMCFVYSNYIREIKEIDTPLVKHDFPFPPIDYKEPFKIMRVKL